MKITNQNIKEILALNWKAPLTTLDVFKITLLLYYKISTAPRFLLVLSYVFQSLSLVYLPNGPHSVRVLELTINNLRQIGIFPIINMEHNKTQKQDTWATCSWIPITIFFITIKEHRRLKKQRPTFCVNNKQITDHPIKKHNK